MFTKKKCFLTKRTNVCWGPLFIPYFTPFTPTTTVFIPFQSEKSEIDYSIFFCYLYGVKGVKRTIKTEQLCKSFSSQIHFPLFSQFFRQIRPSLNSVSSYVNYVFHDSTPNDFFRMLGVKSGVNWTDFRHVLMKLFCLGDFLYGATLFFIIFCWRGFGCRKAWK